MNEQEFAEEFHRLRRLLMESIEADVEAGDDEIHDMIDEILRTNARSFGVSDKVRLARELFSSVRRLGILEELLNDEAVTEIMVNGPDSIFFEKAGKVVRWNRHFESEEVLDNLIQQIVGKCNRVVNASHPIADARLQDGSRVNIVSAPTALGGPYVTIRKFPKETITMEKLIGFGSITAEAAKLLETLVAAGYSMMIGGGTSAGKTTFLNALSNAIPKEERIITIEDNAELQIQGIANLVRLEAKESTMEEMEPVTIRDLVKSALRMRPDRIVVGEVRGAEAIDMLQAYNTGHDGSLTTIHANSAEDMVARLETMTLMAVSLPIPAIRRQIASGIDIFVHLGRLHDHSRRVLEISETDGMEDGEVVLRPLYRWNDGRWELEKCGELKHRTKLARSEIAYE